NGDGMRFLRTVSLHPAGKQPFRRIEMKPLIVGQGRDAAAGNPAHDRIDKTGIAGASRIALNQTHGKIDGRMSGNVEKKKLGGADQKCAFDQRAVLWKAPIEQVAYQAA